MYVPGIGSGAKKENTSFPTVQRFIVINDPVGAMPAGFFYEGRFIILKNPVCLTSYTYERLSIYLFQPYLNGILITF